MKHSIFIVTGAPAAGKSATLNAMLELHTDYTIFDIDWLAESASKLAGKSIYFEPTTWQPYGEVWFAVLEAIYKNGQTPVLFAPFDKDDIARHDTPDWCKSVEWLLLDCNDRVRTERLQARDWTTERIDEALADAKKLRATIIEQIDTEAHTPTEIARRITAWLTESQKNA